MACNSSSMQKEAVEQNGEHDGADGDVEAVALEQKSNDAHDDAGNGRGDEDEQPEHDDAFGVEGCDAVHNSGRRGELRRLGVEVGVVWARAAAVRQI